MKTRIIFLDNLRTFMIFLVVLYHAGFTYQSAMEFNWITVDPIRNETIGLVGLYLDVFVMVVLFFISGYFIPQSVKSKSIRQFIISKFKRIMIPWLVAVILFIPTYKVIFLYSRGLPQESWFTYFHTFQRTGGNLHFFSNNPTQHWLWFLPVLFLFQVLYLGLVKSKLLSWKMSLKSGVLLTFFIGLVSSMAISILGLKGWYHSLFLDFQKERLLVYFMFFLLGSLCFKLNVFEIKANHKKFFILSNVVLSLMLGVYTIVAMNLYMNMIDPGRDYFFISRRVDGIAYYASLLLLMLSFLHILTDTFQHYFNKAGVWMTQLNQNAYYVYTIHMVVLGICALGLINLALPASLKYLILTILTFAGSNILVTLFYRLFQPNPILKLASLAVFLITFLGITHPSNHQKINQSPALISDTIIYPPEIGLHAAVLESNIDAIKQHYLAGTNLNEKEPTGGSSPLITAAVFGKTEAALALIRAGADVNLQNYEGSTALHSAAFFCRIEIVEALLENQADFTIKNYAGSTALDAVSAPFEVVEDIYTYFNKAYGPLGLDLNYDEIKTRRPLIAEILKNQ